MFRSLSLRCAFVLLILIAVWQLGPAAVSGDEDMPQVVNTVEKVTVTNAEEIAKEEFPWGRIRRLMNQKIDSKAPMTFGLVEIEAGQMNPLHMHPNSEEYLYVISGSCKHVVGDKTVVLKKGDLARIPKAVPHKAYVLGDEPLKAIIVYNTGDRQFRVLEEGGKE